MNHSYDVIIIGGGINGLVSGAMLGRAGHKVLLLERTGAPGGAFTNEESYPGFRFNTFMHDLGWFNPSIAQAIEINSSGLQAAQADPGVIGLVQDGCIPFWNDSNRTVEALKAYSTRDAGKWPAFTLQVYKLANFLKMVYSQPVPDLFSADTSEAISLLGYGRQLRGLGKRDMMEMVRILAMSIAEYLDDWFESDEIKGTIGALGITNIAEGPRASGTALVFLHHVLGQPQGVLRAPRVPIGGIGKFAESLGEAARFYGVDTRVGCEVVEIIISDGRATGVILANGDVYQTRVILSTLDTGQTFRKLVNPLDLDPSFVRAIRNIKYRGVRAKVNLALDALPRFTNVGEALLRGYISVSPSIDYLERAYDDAKYGGYSNQPYLEAYIPTLTDPGLAPAGKHILSIWMQFAPYKLKNSDWENQGEALGDLVVRKLAEFAPDLSSKILFRQVLTPPDLERRLGATGGNLYGGELTLDQILFMRPVPGWFRNQTPIDGLYLGGGAVHPGGGHAGASGYLAARQVLNALKK